MSETKTFMKVLAAFFSSIIMSLSLLLVFVAFAISNVDNNIQHIPEVVQHTATQFISENKEEIRAFIDKKLKDEGTLPEFSIQELKAACLQDPNSVPGGVCAKVEEGITAQEARNMMLDALIDRYDDQVTQDILSQTGMDQIQAEVNKASWLFDAMFFIIISGVMLYIFSVFLTFVASSFNVLISLYRVALKTSINLLGIGIVFTYFKYMDAGLIVGFAKDIAVKLGEGFALPSELPDFMIRMLAQIVINWLSLSATPAGHLALIFFIPFAILTGVLVTMRAKRRKQLDLEGKKLSKDDKHFVPKDEIV